MAETATDKTQQEQPPKMAETAVDKTQQEQPPKMAETAVDKTQQEQPPKMAETATDETQQEQPPKMAETAVDKTQQEQPPKMAETAVDKTQQEQPPKMAETAVDKTQQEQPPKMASLQSEEDSTRRPTLLNHIFSWRGLMYLLLHFTYIAWCTPRSATSMVFVCINSRKEKVLHYLNATGTDLVQGDDQAKGDNSSLGYSRNQQIPEEYQQVLDDLAWDASTIGLVLAGATMLAFISPILFDAILHKFSARSVYALTQVVNAALMFSAPSLARASPYLLQANHILLGLTLNATAPVSATLLPRWTPSRHKLTVVGFVYAGPTVGPMILSVLNGFLCSIPVDNGWPFIFYAAGVLHTLFGLAWFFLMGEYPETHRFISEKEKEYIVSRRPPFSPNTQNQKRSGPPYCVLLSSVPVLTFVFVYGLFMWVILVTSVYIPIYLNAVHGFSPGATGIAMAIIFGVRIVGAFFWTSLGNALTNRKILSLPATRKVCICTGLAIAACACLAVSFFNREHRWAAIAFIMLTFFAQAVTVGHLNAVPIDMAPRYAGTIFSLAMSPSLLVSVSAPPIVAAFTPTGIYEEWRLVWYTLSALFFIKTVVFLVLGQARLQPWASPDEKREPQNDKLLES